MQEAFRQQLLTRLSDAYDVKAALQYTAKVWAGQYPTASSPRLLGAVRDELATGEQRSEISLSSPKLALALSSAAVDLQLGWQPSAIEHQIGNVPGVANYQASSWLSFVRPQQNLLDRDLGVVTVPLVLRAFPTAPASPSRTANPPTPRTGSTARSRSTSRPWPRPYRPRRDGHHVVRFEVAEGVTADGALQITLASLTPTGGAAAIVNIPGYTTVNHGNGVFTYTGPDGPLTMAETGSRQRTLPNQLWTLFTALLAGVPDSVTRLQIQAEVVYEYTLATGADPIVLPVFFQPPTTLVQDPNDTDLSKLISNWTNVISGWRVANTPSTIAAWLRFDLTFLSTLTVSAAPLLRLRNAELAVADIIWTAEAVPTPRLDRRPVDRATADPR